MQWNYLKQYNIFLFFFLPHYIQANLELFKADASSDMWKAYIDYLDDMVVDGFFVCIHCSLYYLLENTDVRQMKAPLFVARLELQVGVKQ